MRGKLITLEGVDGSGKSSQVETVRATLSEKGIKTCITREVGGTEVGEDLRNLLLTKNMSPESEILIALAARLEHQRRHIEPLLSAGVWVISDRYTDSTLAYQFGGRLEMQKYLGKEAGKTSELVNLLEILTWTIGDLVFPDLTLFFDLPDEVARKRRGVRAADSDRFEDESEAYFSRVSSTYRTIAASDSYSAGAPTRIHTIDSSKDLEEVSSQVSRVVSVFRDKSLPVVAK